MPATTGQGTTLEFGDFESEITSLQPFSKSWDSIETSHLETAIAQTFIPTPLYDGGEVSLEGHYDPEENEPPDVNDPQPCTIEFPDGEVRYFLAFWTEFTPSVPVNDKMAFSGTLKITGPIYDEVPS
jgi:hypothetical protein